jgi:hypothetical protein
MPRVCFACGSDLPRSAFSRSQWSRGVGNSRCAECVQESHWAGARKATARRNDALAHDWDNWDNPDAEGTFRYVGYGRYTRGSRTGQRCVVKWFKDELQGDFDAFYETELATVDKALQLLTAWNGAGVVKTTVRLNLPEVWTQTRCWGSCDGEDDCTDELTLVEPFIDNFTKFNSNSGWVARDQGGWGELMQALSHFSYHISGGQFLLCDLQGGVYRDGAILTDPVIQSRTLGRFGPTDLGEDGISTFFARHACNQYCSGKGWQRPRMQRAVFAASQGTSMQAGAATAPQRRALLATTYEDSEEDDYYDSDYYY